MLQLVSINKSYSLRGEKIIPVLSDLNLCLKEGSTLVVFGDNGSGKTTLLNIIYGKDFDFNGEIFFNDNNITNLSIEQRSNNFLFLHQNRNIGLPETLTLLELFTINKNINTFFLNKKRLYRELYEKLEKFDIGLENLINRQLKSLSGGEYQLFNMLLLLDRIDNKSEFVVLLDEHTAHLDPYISEQVLKLTNEIIAKTNTSTIITSHNFEQGLSLSNNIGLLIKGKLYIINQKFNDISIVKNLLKNDNFYEYVYNINGGQHCI